MGEVANGSIIRRRAHLWALLGLTILGGIFRFWSLDRPAIWFDEAMTYGRVCGTFGELLDRLQHDGFTPLHYELYWVIGRWVRLTPFAMRFVPALCGTLMIPAMYFLARQMVSRWTSVVAAAIAASSGFLLAYSRDAKMYSEFWLMCTLNVGCLLWWLRRQNLVSWLAWVASGVAMIGLHLVGFVVLGVEAVFLVTRSRRMNGGTSAKTQAEGVAIREITVVLLFLIGVMLIGSGGAVHYFRFSRWSDPHARESDQWFGLQWIDDYNNGREGVDLLRHVATYFVAGYAWPSTIEQATIFPPVVHIEFAWISLVFLLLGLGVIAWPKRWRASTVDAREPPWRVTLWLMLWIVVPAYGFYCASVKDYAGPWDWTTAIVTTARQRIILALIVVAIASVILLINWRARTLKAQLLRLAQLGVIVLGVLLICFGVNLAFKTHQPNSLWVPRYLGFIWPAVGVGMAILLMRLPTLPLRLLALAVVMVVNVAQEYWLVRVDVEPPIDQIAHDVWQTQNSSHERAYVDGALSGFIGPGGGSIFNVVGKYYLSIESGRTLHPNQMQPFGRWQMAMDEPWQINRVGIADMIVANVARNPQLDHVIVWDQLTGTGTPEETLAGKLPGKWKLISEGKRPVFAAWWQYRYIVRRREYRKVEAD